MVAQPTKPTTKNEPSLAEAIEKAHADYLASLKPKRRLPREFLDGVVKGFGMAVGGTIVFGIVIYLVGRFLVAPQAQLWLSDIENRANEFQQSFTVPGNFN